MTSPVPKCVTYMQSTMTGVSYYRYTDPAGKRIRIRLTPNGVELFNYSGGFITISLEFAIWLASQSSIRER